MCRIDCAGSTLTPSPPPPSPLKTCEPLTVLNFVAFPFLACLRYLGCAARVRRTHSFVVRVRHVPFLAEVPVFVLVLPWLVPILGLVPGFVLILALALVLRPSSQKEPRGLLGILGGSSRGSPRGSHMGFLKEVPLGAALGAGRDHRGTP